MRRLHLIDGTFELFRAFYAVPSAKAPDGQEVGAIRGLIGSTLAWLRDAEVSHVAAATDHVIESFRNDLFDGYKTGEGIDPDLWSQFPLAEDALRALGVCVWPMVEFEADDAIATAAARFGGEVEQVVILSPDKDFGQCVDDQRVVIHDRIRRIIHDEAAIVAKFGVPPSAIADLLALVGDRADGIPGIPGWGKQSAAAILREYGSIEAIPAEPRSWSIALRGRDRLGAVLSERRADALLYKRLATLRRDVPLKESFSDLAWQGVPREPFLALCDRIGSVDLRQRPFRWRDD